MTYHPKSEFIHTMMQRGFLADCTDYQGLDDALRQGAAPAYVGYDATAKSLHVGHLVNIMMLRWLQKCGGKPITLMGGGTTKVGDPSFRSDERPLLTPEAIDDNIEGIRQVFARYLDYGDGPSDALMLNNAEWLDELNYLDFLRDIGRHFSINRMLSFESVKSRLDREQSLSFLEFNYMILQAYDFMELHRRYGCILQMGGSDQWGNIVNGIDLTRRVIDGEVYGLTSPLLTTSDGKKMGKSAGGAVWLNGDMLSPYEFWQFWRNCTDADVGRFLKLYTELPVDECDRLGALAGSEINEAKVRLANEVTGLLHGEEAARNAEATARALACFNPIYWIAGGRNKSNGLKALQPNFRRIAHAFLIGEAEQAFADELDGRVNYSCCGTLANALDAASAQACADGRPGAVVLFSPACASFDQFADFEVRGETFREMVVKLEQRHAEQARRHCA